MPRQKSLGDLEQKVMQFLWKNSPATGEQVRRAVGKGRSLTDSTVRTVLRRLEAKDFVRHEVEGRQFLYSATRGPRKVAADAVRGILTRFCRGSLEELLTGLVDHEVVNGKELERLARKIRDRERKEKGS